MWWPTRLLYIGGLGYGNLSSQELSHCRIKLHLTQGKQPEGPYLTLSHCWGSTKEMMKLTDADYKRRVENGFSFGELPKTFQDAIRLSRFLCTDYIWIDSLCILQDNKKDWLQESKTMADVYRFSRCNIAATASQASTEGCFYDRDPRLVSPLEIMVRLQKAGGGSPKKRYLFFDPGVWKDNVEAAPLNKRAWVLQERTLAPRQIHCGRKQLSWECHETSAYETFPFSSRFQGRVMPSGWDWTYRLPSITPVLSEMIRLISSEIGDSKFPKEHISYESLLHQYGIGEVSTIQRRLADVEGTAWDMSFALLKNCINREWVNIVNHYSGCKSTYRADKLTAISGIASRIQDVLKSSDYYVAGLWKSELPLQLLWKVEWQKRMNEKNEPSDLIPSYTIAPSWSWACLNIEVHMLHNCSYCPPTYPMIKVDGVRDVHNIDGTKEWDLKLRCRLYEIYSLTARANESIQDGLTGFILVGSRNVHLRWGPNRISMDSPDSINPREQAYLMPAINLYEDGFHDADRRYIEGLVVRSCEGRQGYYRRIGWWSTNALDSDCKHEILAAQEESQVTITLI